MKSNRIFDTLLKSVSLSDYDDLIEQEELRQAGFVLHFVIDADLIGNYCFPKGIIEEETSLERRRRLTDDYIADEQVTLHSVFTLNKKQDRVIIADEHFPEFKAMLIKASGRNIDKINLGLGQVSVKSLKDGQFKDYLYDNFSKAIAEVLVKINGLKKAANLFKEKLIIFEADDFKNPLLTEATQTCRTTKRQDYIVDIWEKVIRRGLHPSKTRDAGIIDRILSINWFLQNNNNNNNGKHVFIYLTDSPNTKPLFHYLIRHPDKLQYPTVAGKNISFIRSVPQTFAYLISLKYTDPDHIDIAGTIRNLKELRKTSQQVNDVIEDTQKVFEIDNDEERFEDEIFSNYNQLRNVFENTGLLKSFQGLYKSIKSDIEDLNLWKIQELFDRVTNEMGLLQDLTSDHANYLSKLYDEALFSTAFLKGLTLLKSSTTPLNLSKGCDSVEGSYQHLPIFLSFPLESQSYSENMNYLMLLILDRKNDKELFSVQLMSLVQKMETTSNLLEEQIEMKLLKAFVLMIMPSFNNLRIETNVNPQAIVNDVLAERWLKIIYDNGRSIRNLNLQLHADLLYQLCWVSRRIGKYRDALSYANEGKKLFANDPRFFHGHFLANYSQLEEKGNNNVEQRIKILKSILDELIIAQKLYRPFLVENFNGYNSDLMELRLQETFCNSSCYLLTLIANEHHKANEDSNIVTSILTSAREQLYKLKQLSFVDWMPEYCDTEAFLEFLESFYFESKIQKLEHASIAINRAISSTMSLNLKIKYQERSDQIESRLSNMRQV